MSDLPETPAIRRRAAEWIALRHARALTLTEQADLADWLAADPRHQGAFSRLEATWRTFDRVAAVPHSVDQSPDPDLLAPRRRARTRMMPRALAAAAALAIGAVFWFKPHASAPVAIADAKAQTTRMSLPDGSTVELNAGAEVQEHFTAGERRIALLHGEAHFSVAKNPNRPFIVEANGVAVRAVGTAFDVKLAPTTVEVLVTEGTVQVAQPKASLTVAPPVTVLTIGQRTVVSTAPQKEPFAPAVVTLAPAEIDRALAWQTTRYRFEDVPLGEVVARFNADAKEPRLIVSDPELATLRISGRVRTDNIDSFVEVLESTFDISAERTAGGAVILRHRARP